MGGQPIAGHTHTPFTHTCTPTGNVATPISLGMFLDCGGKPEYREETPRRHGENMQTPHTCDPGGDSNPGPRGAVTDVEMQEHYDEFFEEVFTEMEEKYGEVEEMNVCDNLGDHLVGNVYVKFCREEDSEKAVIDLNNRWFNGQPIHAELSPVTDFREACCCQYEMGGCTRGGFCNFMHRKPFSRELRKELYGRRRKRQTTASDLSAAM
ncbi:splicing factor U2AF 35 kDa subunit-like [Brienomyrus brachyistius]|uniref:splicing factor U2AF 35 kDa subunit-like n=1 Tax=Brienomyrus brachyistius TaxID=42636 RepID=UPI0020B2D372|nr:splicing factor U2AF 35 kDa subunit-like [Brienomyrus brachyistius]